jgi:hypothetical protein
MAYGKDDITIALEQVGIFRLHGVPLEEYRAAFGLQAKSIIQFSS